MAGIAATRGGPKVEVGEEIQFIESQAEPMQEERPAIFAGRNRKGDWRADGSHLGCPQAIQVSGSRARKLEFVVLLLDCVKTHLRKKHIGHVP